jgi:hypothetical protein
MDDERIRALTREVLEKLRGPAAPGEAGDLEARVAALEAAVGRMSAGGTAVPAAAPTAVAVAVAATPGHAHPALRLLDVCHGEDQCILEPDKPCCKSGRCRTFGY